MAKKLQDLLGDNHPLFISNIRALELATNNQGIDLSLIAEITQKSHDIMRQLGLDLNDTTSTELYKALLATVPSQRAEVLLSDTTYVLVNLGDGPISLNINDVVDCYHHELSFDQRVLSHAQLNLRSEIVKRYADYDKADKNIIINLCKEIGLEEIINESTKDINESNISKPTVLAVGDIFTDAFIKLCDDKARIDTDPDGSKRLSMPFGSKPPYDRVDIVQAVGPSPNAAVAMSRLGLDSQLLAFLGDDQPGQDSLNYLVKENINISKVSIQKDIKSNYYYVLRYGADRTILVKNEAYDYKWTAPDNVPDWIYLSLISEDSWQLHEDLINYLNQHPDVKLAFQPGTFHFKWGSEKLANVYKRSYIVVMNREEAVEVTGFSYDSLKDLANGLHSLGPEIVVITDGPNGSYASYDAKIVSIPNYPDPKPPLDRTGAGDAFSSTIVAALSLGQSIETALKWAPINSMSVVQQLGAQAGLLNTSQIQELLSIAPDYYRISEME